MRFRSDIGNEGKDIGGGDEGGHAEKTDERDLDETRHDQSGDVRHGGDNGDSEEDALAGVRKELLYYNGERPTLYSSFRSSSSALSLVMSFSCSGCQHQYKATLYISSCEDLLRQDFPVCHHHRCYEKLSVIS